jgi:hypothetical protein
MIQNSGDLQARLDPHGTITKIRAHTFTPIDRELEQTPTASSWQTSITWLFIHCPADLNNELIEEKISLDADDKPPDPPSPPRWNSTCRRRSIIRHQ